MKKYVTLFLLSFMVFTVLNQATAQTMGWRGENRTGVYHSKNLLAEWPEEGPELLLHVDSLPMAYSSVTVVNDVVYTTGIKDTAEVLTAVNLDGKILWSVVYGRAWKGSYPNARCTPTIEGDFAYLTSGDGYLACVNIKTGKVAWMYDAFTKFEGECGRWGVAESPLIIDDKLIYTPCGTKTTMVAVNKKSGDVIWQSECLNDISAYCSPTILEKGDTKLIISVTSNYIIGVNADNGDIYWKFKYIDVDKPFMGGDINPVTPLVVDDEIFVTSGYNHTAVMLKLADDLKSVSLKWKSEDLDTHHGGVVLYNGYIYGSNYTSIRNGNWVCLDWETGDKKYETEWLGKGSVIAVDGYLICYEERRGNLALVEANPEKFNIKSSFKVEQGNGPHWSHPVIDKDKMFIRHGESLMVYRVGKD